ncbi:MAG: MMPL family transporter, partial [Proteobacteria bacterium]|nr:MMPL family transporter [Pseudomonadota bacterium]
VANGLITILVMPLMLSLFGPDQNTSLVKDTETNSVPDRVMRVFRYSQSHFPMSILLVTILLCAFFIYQASKLYVTNDPLSYFPGDRPLIQDTKRIHKDLSGVKIFFISVHSKQGKAFLEPKNLQKLVEIQRFLDAQNIYDRNISLADHLMFMNQEFQGGMVGKLLPETKQLVAQYLMFLHRSDLDSYVSHDFSRANIVVRHNLSDSHTLNRYIEELNEVIGEIIGPDMTFFIVGENLMVNNAAESLMVAQVKALVLLLSLIFLIMSAMFTSFKGGFIALVPAIIPIALMFGIMGFLDIPLNPGTAMVAVIAIGIAIDGTIHLLARYNELCRRTSDYMGAVNTAVHEEATPLIVSSIALAFGFGVLIFSNFTIVAQFGALAAATMLFSIFANLLITPIIMARIRLVGLYQILAMSIDRHVLDTSPLLQNMSDYQRRKAILISEIHEFEKGDLLVEQDTIGRDMYLILSG